MAKDKKGFILYADLLKVCEKLILRDRANKTNYTGELFYAILLYVNDLEELIDVEFIVELAFEPIKLQLKRDLKKFEAVKEKRSAAGKRSAELRAEQKATESTLVECVENDLTNSTVRDKDSVNVNVKDIYIYTEKQFLERWKAARLHFDKKETNISKLQAFELVNFNKLIQMYDEKQFDKAISGLFFQETYPAIRLRPTHFLEVSNFEKYLTCWENQIKMFDKPKVKKFLDGI